MTTVLNKPKLTPEDLLQLPKDRRYELVDGELVEKTTAWTSAVVTAHLVRLLSNYCEQQNLGGIANSSASYACFPGEPDKVRKPDISFIRRERITPELWQPGHIRIAPDLVVEVLSPNDIAAQTEERIEDFLRSGVPLVWVIQPETRRVYVYHADGPGVILRENDELTGEPVLPGFRLSVREIFTPLDRYGATTAQSTRDKETE